MESIYVHKDNRQCGPYSTDYVRQMLSEGKLKGSDYIWFQGCKDWILLSSIKQFQDARISPVLENSSIVQQENKSMIMADSRGNRLTATIDNRAKAYRSNRQVSSGDNAVIKSFVSSNDADVIITEKDHSIENKVYISVDDKNEASKCQICPFCKKTNESNAIKCICGYYFDKNEYNKASGALTPVKASAVAEVIEDKKNLAGQYAGHMIAGALWVIGGSIATAIGYNMAASNPSGGTYFIFWGAIIFGIYDFLKGFFGWIKYSL